MNFKIHNIWKNIAFFWTNLLLILFSIEILYIELHNRIWRIVIIISGIHWTFFFWSRVYIELSFWSNRYTLNLIGKYMFFLVQNWQILSRYMFFFWSRENHKSPYCKHGVFWQPLCKRGYGKAQWESDQKKIK